MDNKSIWDIFKFPEELHTTINENLKLIGLDPLPNDVYNYVDVMRYLEDLKKRFEERLKELSIQKSTYEGEEEAFNVKKDIIKTKIERIEDLIKEVVRDMKCLKIYHDTYEQNKDIRDTSDLNEYLMDFSEVEVKITETEKRMFSNFISTLLLIKKNVVGTYPKVMDYKEFKEAVREQWKQMKTHPSIPELIKKSIFRTCEAVDAILA